MPDVRPSHTTIANSLYGPRGPQQALGQFSPRSLTTKLRFAKAPPEPPQSLAEHIGAAISHVPGLTPKQRNAVAAVRVEKTRDLHFVKLIMDQMPRAPQQDEGRAL